MPASACCSPDELTGLEALVDIAQEERTVVTGRRAQRLVELELQDVTHEVPANHTIPLLGNNYDGNVVRMAGDVPGVRRISSTWTLPDVACVSRDVELGAGVKLRRRASVWRRDALYLAPAPS